MFDFLCIISAVFKNTLYFDWKIRKKFQNNNRLQFHNWLNVSIFYFAGTEIACCKIQFVSLSKQQVRAPNKERFIPDGWVLDYAYSKWVSVSKWKYVFNAQKKYMQCENLLRSEIYIEPSGKNKNANRNKNIHVAIFIDIAIQIHVID